MHDFSTVAEIAAILSPALAYPAFIKIPSLYIYAHLKNRAGVQALQCLCHCFSVEMLLGYIEFTVNFKVLLFAAAAIYQAGKIILWQYFYISLLGVSSML